MRSRSSTTSASTSTLLNAMMANAEANASTFSMSAPMASRTPGYCTLTAARRPSFSTTRWTWPIDAAATGMGSQSAKSWRGCRPSSSSTTDSARLGAIGGTSAWRVARISRTSSGRPGAMKEIIWPSFMMAPFMSPSSAVTSSADRMANWASSAARRCFVGPDTAHPGGRVVAGPANPSLVSRRDRWMFSAAASRSSRRLLTAVAAPATAATAAAPPPTMAAARALLTTGDASLGGRCDQRIEERLGLVEVAARRPGRSPGTPRRRSLRPGRAARCPARRLGPRWDVRPGQPEVRRRSPDPDSGWDLDADLVAADLGLVGHVHAWAFVDRADRPPLRRPAERVAERRRGRLVRTWTATLVVDNASSRRGRRELP